MSYENWDSESKDLSIVQNSALIVDFLAFTFHRSMLVDFVSNNKFLKDVSIGGTPLNVENFGSEIYLGNGLNPVLSNALAMIISEVFGFNLSSPRGKGLNGYFDSCTLKTKPLLDPDTGEVLGGVSDVGFVGFGGNNDTIFVTISGTGCRSLFDRISYENLHFFLKDCLAVSVINRLDIAFDDCLGKINPEYVKSCYRDLMFKSQKGGKNPCFGEIINYNSEGVKSGHTLNVGSRQSNVFWRVYDKAAEQKVNDGFSWWRAEVELKKVSIDALLDPSKTYSSVNLFAQDVYLSIPDDQVVKFRIKVVRASSNLKRRVDWVNRTCKNIFNDVLFMLNGNLKAFLSVILNGNDNVSSYFPNTDRIILNSIFAQTKYNVNMFNSLENN